MTAAREARQRRRYAPLAEHIAWPISEAIFAQIHSFALDEGDAFNTAAEIFDDVIACLRRDPVFAHHSTADLEFRFGDLVCTSNTNSANCLMALSIGCASSLPVRPWSELETRYLQARSPRHGGGRSSSTG